MCVPRKPNTYPIIMIAFLKAISSQDTLLTYANIYLISIHSTLGITSRGLRSFMGVSIVPAAADWDELNDSLDATRKRFVHGVGADRMGVIGIPEHRRWKVQGHPDFASAGLRASQAFVLASFLHQIL